MKITKRIVSVVLALLMVFGSVSALAYAEAPYKLTVNVEYYRLVDGEWKPTDRIARGEQVQARIFVGTNYAAGVAQYFWAYPQDFMAPYTEGYASHLVGDFSIPLGATTTANGWGGYLAYGTGTDDNAFVGDLTYEEDGIPPYIEGSFFDTHDHVSVIFNAGTYAYPLSISDWAYRLDFKVAANAESVDNALFIPEGSLCKDAETEWAVTYVALQKNGEGAGFADKITYGDAFVWDFEHPAAPLQVTSKITVDAGDAGTVKTDGYIKNGEYGQTIGEAANLTVPVVEGKDFIGWSYAGATYYADAADAPADATDVKTIADLETIAVGYEDVTISAVYEETEEVPTKDSYTQNVYVMDTEGNYDEENPVVNTIKDIEIGTEVSASDYEITEEGFSLDEAKSTMTPVKVAEGDDDVVNVYLERAKPAVTFYDYYGEIITEEGQYYDAEVAAPGHDEIPGMTFDGWYLDGGDDKLAAGDKVPVDGAEYFAKYTDDIYTVTYYNEDGTVFAKQSGEDSGYYYGDSLVYPEGKPAEPDESQYFDGWSVPAGTEVTKNMDVYPIFETYVYGVFFEDYYGEPLDSFEMERSHGTTVAVADLPDAADLEEIEGYEFKYWTLEGEQVKEDIVVTDDIVLTAYYEAVDVVLTFNAAGGHFPETTTDVVKVTAKYDSEITEDIVPADPERDGYDFVGWDYDPVGALVDNVAGMEYNATWIALDSECKVEVYTENLEADKAEKGEYSLYATIKDSGKTGAEIYYDDAEIEGFTMQAYTPVKITADGKATLKVYYTRNDVVIDINGEEKTVEYGTPIDEPADPSDLEEYEEVTGWEVNGAEPEKWPVEAEDGMVITPVIGNKSYAIVFMNGDQKITDEAQEYGKAIKAPEAPAAPAGYDFAGWYTDVDDETTKLTAETVVPVNGATYYAKFDAVDGIGYTVNVYTENLEADKATNGEWKLESSTPGKGKTDDNIPYNDAEIEGFTMQAYTPVKITADGKAVLNVYYTRDTVTVTVNGTPDEVEYGAPIAEPSDPEDLEPGTEVTGWEVNGEEPEKWPVAAEDGMVITPVIGNKSYAIVFMNGDQKITDAAQEYGTAIVVPDAPVVTGYTFGGWYTDLEDETTKLTATTVVPVDGATYYAKLTVNTHTVTFVGEDGAELKKVENVAYGTDLSTIAPDAPDVEGKTFSAWIDSDAGTKMPATMPDKDVTYKASYAGNDAAPYSIKIYVMDAEGNYTLKSSSTASAPIGTVVTLEDESEENIGCYLDTTKSTLSATVQASGTVLEAYYARNIVTIKFVDEDGVEVAKAITGLYGSAVTAPEPETRDYYTFEGWSPEVPSTMPLEDLVVVAQYKEVPIELIRAEGAKTEINKNNWIITGLGLTIRDEDDYDRYLDVTGNGHYEVTPVSTGKYGTGSIVELIHNETGEVLETYYVVIYGDLDGDAQIGSADITMARDEAAGKTYWSDETDPDYDRIKTLAGDINQNGYVDITDTTVIREFVGGELEIDQVTLDVTYY